MADDKVGFIHVWLQRRFEGKRINSDSCFCIRVMHICPSSVLRSDFRVAEVLQDLAAKIKYKICELVTETCRDK